MCPVGPGAWGTPAQEDPAAQEPFLSPPVLTASTGQEGNRRTSPRTHLFKQVSGGCRQFVADPGFTLQETFKVSLTLLGEWRKPGLGGVGRVWSEKGLQDSGPGGASSGPAGR